MRVRCISKCAQHWTASAQHHAVDLSGPTDLGELHFLRLCMTFVVSLLQAISTVDSRTTESGTTAGNKTGASYTKSSSPNTLQRCHCEAIHHPSPPRRQFRSILLFFAASKPVLLAMFSILIPFYMGGSSLPGAQPEAREKLSVRQGFCQKLDVYPARISDFRAYVSSPFFRHKCLITGWNRPRPELQAD